MRPENMAYAPWPETFVNCTPSGEMTGTVSHCARLCPTMPPPNSNACQGPVCGRSEEHTSELQSLMRISYAVFCLKTKKPDRLWTINHTTLLNHIATPLPSY